MDSQIMEVVQKLQERYKERGLDISQQSLIDIVTSQFRVATFGFKKGVNVRLPFFGSFTIHDYKKSLERNKALQQLEGTVSEEEFKRLKIERNLLSKEERKQMNAIDKKTTHTLEDLKNTKDINNRPHRYDKL